MMAWGPRPMRALLGSHVFVAIGGGFSFSGMGDIIFPFIAAAGER